VETACNALREALWSLRRIHVAIGIPWYPQVGRLDGSHMKDELIDELDVSWFPWPLYILCDQNRSKLGIPCWSPIGLPWYPQVWESLRRWVLGNER